jgi:hypothetical protein
MRGGVPSSLSTMSVLNLTTASLGVLYNDVRTVWIHKRKLGVRTRSRELQRRGRRRRRTHARQHSTRVTWACAVHQSVRGQRSATLLCKARRPSIAMLFASDAQLPARRRTACGVTAASLGPAMTSGDCPL